MVMVELRSWKLEGDEEGDAGGAGDEGDIRARLVVGVFDEEHDYTCGYYGSACCDEDVSRHCMGFDGVDVFLGTAGGGAAAGPDEIGVGAPGCAADAYAYAGNDDAGCSDD